MNELCKHTTLLLCLLYVRMTATRDGVLVQHVSLTRTLICYTFNTAIAARMFSGLLSGNLGVVKSLLTEITDDTNRGAAFSYMSLAWAIGTVIAPLAGGMLCKPAEKYPKVFPDKHGELFVEFPYLLPCLLCVCWSLFSALWCVIFMKETRINKKNSSGKETAPEQGLELTTVRNKIISRMAPTTGYSRVDSENDAEGVNEEDFGDVEAADFGTMSSISEQKYSKLQAHLQHGLSAQDITTSTSTAAGASTGAGSSFSCEDGSATYSPVLMHTAAQKISQDMFVIADGSSDEEQGEGDDSHVHGKGGRIHIDMTRALQDSKAHKHPTVRITESTETDTDTETGSFGADHSSNGSTNSAGNNSGTEEEEEDWSEEDQLCCAARTSTNPSLDSSSHNLNSGEDGEPARLSTATILRQRVVVLATGNYGMLCAAAILIEETLPLFLKAPINEGGFGFNSMHIGLLLSISGCVMLVFTSYFLPIISRRSKFWMFKVGTIGSIPVALSMPFIALLNRTVLSHLSDQAHWWILWTLLPLVNVLKSVFSCLAFGAVMIQVNHSVHDEYLGAVNGLGQSLAALARAIGPAIGGAMWSLSTRHHFVYLNFIVIAVAFCVCLYLNSLLPASLDYKKRVRNAKNAGSGESGAPGPMFH